MQVSIVYFLLFLLVFQGFYFEIWISSALHFQPFWGLQVALGLAGFGTHLNGLPKHPLHGTHIQPVITNENTAFSHTVSFLEYFPPLNSFPSEETIQVFIT